jgi:hypothetical protein
MHNSLGSLTDTRPGRPLASADLDLAPACGICAPSGHRACSGAAAGAGPCPASGSSRPRLGCQPSPARRAGCRPAPSRPAVKRRSDDLPIPPVQGPEDRAEQSFPLPLGKNLNQCPCLHLAGSHRRQPRSVAEPKDTAEHAGHRVREPGRQSAASTGTPESADERAIGSGLVRSFRRDGVSRAACHVPDRMPIPRVDRDGSRVAWSAHRKMV